MNPEQSRLRQQQREETVVHQQTGSQQQERTFDSVEELLRHDADQTAVPADIQQRLAASIANEPKPVAVPWWKRWFAR